MRPALNAGGSRHRPHGAGAYSCFNEAGAERREQTVTVTGDKTDKIVCFNKARR